MHQIAHEHVLPRLVPGLEPVQCKVNAPVAQARQHIAPRLRDEVHIDIRVLIKEAHDVLKQVVRVYPRAKPDAQGLAALSAGVYLAAEAAPCVRHCPRLAAEFFSRGCERKAARCAGKERVAKLRLQPLHLLRKRRLRQIQPRRRGGYAPAVRYLKDI